MAQRLSQTLVRHVQEHPLASLSGLVSIGLEVATLWLLSGIWGHVGIDAHRAALGQAVGMLGAIMLLPVMWTTPFNDTARENAASPSGASAAMMQPPVGVRRIAFIAWGMLLLLALAQVVAVISGGLGYAAALGFVLGVLNVVAFVGGLVLRESTAGRQR